VPETVPCHTRVGLNAVHAADVAVVADDAVIPDQMSRCPFIQHNVTTEAGREEALDLAFTAQAALQGIVFHSTLIRRPAVSCQSIGLVQVTWPMCEKKTGTQPT